MNSRILTNLIIEACDKIREELEKSSMLVEWCKLDEKTKREIMVNGFHDTNKLEKEK